MTELVLNVFTQVSERRFRIRGRREMEHSLDGTGQGLFVRG